MSNPVRRSASGVARRGPKKEFEIPNLSEGKSDPLIVARSEAAARLCALAVTALGGAVLAGWWLEVAALKSVLPGWATMKANTALGFLLAGLSLLLAGNTPGAGWSGIQRALATIVMLLGVLTLGEYLWSTDFGLDYLLIPADPMSGSAPPSGRMAVATATGFCLTGLALFMLDARRGRMASTVAAICGNLIGVLGVLGYAYGVNALYGIGAFSSVAVHSAFGFVVVNLGVILVRPRRSLMAIATSRTVGGVMARRLLPVALIAPFVLGWLRLKGEQHGLFGLEFGVALLTLAYVALFSTFIWRTAVVLHQSDQRRSAAERARQHQQAQMTGIIDSAMDAIIMVDSRQRITLFNAAAEKMFDRRAADVTGESLDILLPARFRGTHHEHIRAFGATGTTSRRMGGLGAITGVRASGEEFPIEASISQSQSNGDKYYTVILRDITRRQRIEADLRIAAIAFEAQIGILVTDAQGVILRANRAFVAESGYQADELIGRTTQLLRSGRHDASFYAALWESITQTGAWEGEIWERRKNGQIYPKWMVITAVKGPDGVATHYVSTQTDITLRKAADEEIKSLAFYDPLTRLPNRRLLVDRLHQALATSWRNQKRGALLFIDLDNFKLLNDTLGHDQGDLLLKAVANRLTDCVREGDTVARLGGDEFVVLLENLSATVHEAATQAEMVAEKILAALNRPHRLCGQDCRCTPSIGLTLYGDQHETLEGLLKQGDLAMYEAKAAGRNGLCFFDSRMQAAVNAHVNLERDLRSALAEGQFVLYYEAQVNAAGELTGAEALVRWQHPQRGLVLPDDFIQVAEETGLILPLGYWVMEAACAQLAAWAGREETCHLTLSVNVSIQQLRQADFVDQVLTVLHRSGADPTRLGLELTESLLVDDMADTVAKMALLKARGVGFVLDDFGTGYSSLTHLKRLPLDQLKIDRAFVRDVLNDAHDADIVKAIIALAGSLGLAAIAEGVDSEEQRAFLAEHGCAAYQGLLFGRPLPLAEFERGFHAASEISSS